MIERIGDLDDTHLPDGAVVALRAVGQLSIDDYRAVIEPEIARVADAAHRLRLMLHLGEQFTGFGEGAWGDLTADIRQMRFHRGAVVTDDRVIRTGLNVLKWTLKGEVRTFRNHEYDSAVSWLLS